MSSPLLDSLMNFATPQLIGSLASRLGESESAVQKGLSGGSAAVLGAIAGRAGDAGFLSQIFGLITGSGASGILGNLAGLASGNAPAGTADLGSRFLSMVLGSQQSGAMDLIGRAAGLKSSSMSGLMGMVGPLVLGYLSKRASADGMSAAGLGRLLSAEAPALKGLLPAGFGDLLPSFGLPSTPAIPAPEVTSERGSWLLPAAIGLALLGVLFWFLTTSREPVKEAATQAAQTATQATSAVTDAARGAWAALGEFFKRKLPNGVELDIPRLGVENKLVDFIEDAARPVDKTTWFDFDRLLFDTGSATLRPASQEQLGNIAAILKAFPKVQIKIGGYTDNTGDPAANQKLSTDRAGSVMNELIKLGVEPARLTAEGYGDQHPVADNATEEGRARNRRISMRVTAK